MHIKESILAYLLWHLIENNRSHFYASASLNYPVHLGQLFFGGR